MAFAARKNGAEIAHPWHYLYSCATKAKNHLQFFQFARVETEVDLIFARCGIFKKPPLFSQMTICPHHRSSLGIGWRRSSKLCCVLENVSGHSSRGLSLSQSRTIHEVTNVLLPVGSGKVFNVFVPKIDCGVGGNSCFVPLKTQPPPSHRPVIVFFAVACNAWRQEVPFVIYSLVQRPTCNCSLIFRWLR